MPHTLETLVDESGVEINVAYSWCDSPEFEAEPGNPNTYVTSLRETIIDSVEVVIKGEGFNLMELINKLPVKRKDKVLSAIVHELSHEL